MLRGRLAARAKQCLIVLLLFGLAACQAGPPVQEMSDARQAIAAAREAGADTLAADELREAERYLEYAEQRLNEKAYSQARRDAQQAKRSALSALSIADETDKSDN